MLLLCIYIYRMEVKMPRQWVDRRRNDKYLSEIREKMREGFNTYQIWTTLDKKCSYHTVARKVKEIKEQYEAHLRATSGEFS